MKIVNRLRAIPMGARRAGAAFGAALAGTAAMAQTTGGGGGVDYTTAIDGFKTDIGAFVTGNALPLLGVLVTVLGFGVVWRLLSKAGRSVGK